MEWKVIGIIDGDTFKVSPRWKWRGQTGNRVRPLGYNTPEKGQAGYDDATKKLREIILGKKVEFGKAVKIDRGRLLCDVFIEGENIADFFPEYKV